MLAMVDCTLWAKLSVLFGKDVKIMTNLNGDICMNAPSWACTYIPWQSSYPRGIVIVSLSNILHCTTLYTRNACSYARY